MGVRKPLTHASMRVSLMCASDTVNYIRRVSGRRRGRAHSSVAGAVRTPAVRLQQAAAPGQTRRRPGSRPSRCVTCRSSRSRRSTQPHHAQDMDYPRTRSALPRLSLSLSVYEEVKSGRGGSKGTWGTASGANPI